MEQRGQPAFFIAGQQAPAVQCAAKTSPTITAQTLWEVTRVRYGVCLSCFARELDTEPRRESALRNKRGTVRLDKRLPARLDILRMERAAVELGEIKIGAKQPRREA